MSVTVEDGRVTQLEGTHDNPLTQGFICSKVRSFPRRVYGEERIRTPLVRVGPKGEGRFREASWQEAMTLLVSRIDEVRARHGGEAILPLSYGGSNGLLSQDTTDARLFARLGACRLQRSVCAAATGAAAAALYGKMAGVAFADYPEAELIVVWGANPSASGIHLVPILAEAQRRGSRLVVIDPRRTPMAAKADLHLQLRPGTDLPVAASLLRHLFHSGDADRDFLAAHCDGARRLEERVDQWSFERAAAVAGLEPQDLENLAQWYAAADPALIRCGWGLERNRNGGSAVAAVLALPAVGGKFGKRGGGYTLSNSGAVRLRSDLAAAAEAPSTRLVNMNHVGRALAAGAEPPIHLLFVYNHNPLQTLPDQNAVRQGLAREDLFTVVFDQTRTDTAQWADLVLPATTFLEHHDWRVSYGEQTIQEVRPVIEPVGESRPNHEVFQELCTRLGLDREGDPRGREAIEAALSADHPSLAEDLRRDGRGDPPAGARPVQMLDVRPATDDGRIHLFPLALDEQAPGGLYHYQEDPATESFPLALISPATSRTISSSLGELHRRQVPLEMHPGDAAERGLERDDEARVYNHLGEVHCKVRLNDGLRRGVAVLPKGLWSHNTLNGSSSNALVADSLTDLGGGACFNDARVQVERLARDTRA
jgi:anaerobic selenocysteine-containing dehydrogenase